MRIPTTRHLSLARSSPLAPMIDLVFLLVFFLIVTAELGKAWHSGHVRRREDLRLPRARAARPASRGQRLVVRVLADGTFLIEGTPRSDEWVYTMLLVEARLSRGRDGYSGRQLSIEADERVEFKHVQKIIEWCRDARIRIWRLAFGARPPDEDDDSVLPE